MLIDHNLKLAFVAVPKTGSTSIHYALLSATDEEFEFKSEAPELFHLCARDLQLIVGVEAVKSYFSFAVVRNPYDRLVSLYSDFKQSRGLIEAEDFSKFVRNQLEESWIDDVHFQPQSFFTSHHGELLLDRIYRFEAGLEVVLDDIGRRFSFRSYELGHSRKSDRVDWRAYFHDQAVIDVTNRLYAEDFDTFGYERIERP